MPLSRRVALRGQMDSLPRSAFRGSRKKEKQSGTASSLTTQERTPPFFLLDRRVPIKRFAELFRWSLTRSVTSRSGRSETQSFLRSACAIEESARGESFGERVGECSRAIPTAGVDFTRSWKYFPEAPPPLPFVFRVTRDPAVISLRRGWFAGPWCPAASSVRFRSVRRRAHIVSRDSILRLSSTSIDEVPLHSWLRGGL